MDVFLLGFVVGLVAVGILYVFWRTISAWLGDINAPNKPQKVVHSTEKTPAEITGKADSAKVMLYLAISTVVLALWLILDYSYPTVTTPVYRLIVEVFLFIIDILIRILTMLYNLLLSLEP